MGSRKERIMSDNDVSKCKYYANIYKDKYGKNFFNYCHLYNDKCDKYPQCIYRDKQLQQLKAGNEELKEENQEMYKMGCENFVAIDQAKRLYKLNKCLDEIKEYIDNFCENVCPYYVDEGESCDNCMVGDIVQPIKEKIKEVKVMSNLCEKNRSCERGIKQWLESEE